MRGLPLLVFYLYVLIIVTAAIGWSSSSPDTILIVFYTPKILSFYKFYWRTMDAKQWQWFMLVVLVWPAKIQKKLRIYTYDNNNNMLSHRYWQHSNKTMDSYVKCFIKTFISNLVHTTPSLCQKTGKSTNFKVGSK